MDSGEWIDGTQKLLFRRGKKGEKGGTRPSDTGELSEDLLRITKKRKIHRERGCLDALWTCNKKGTREG